MEDRKLNILKSIYESVGLKINLKEVGEIFLDLTQIAIELGIYDVNKNPILLTTEVKNIVIVYK